MNPHYFRSARFLVGLVVFFCALITYGLCVQPTVPFWDCGEFTAAIVHQQVPHPPGAPLFLMMGKIAHLLPIGDPAMRVNMLSAVFSAVTIWLLFEIIILSVASFRPRSDHARTDVTDVDTAGETSESVSFSTLAAASIGALAFCFSDTFWFNAVESEVYAASTLVVALICTFLLRWYLASTSRDSVRYLVMIAYLIGLSLGIHLLSVLTLFTVVIVVATKRYGISTTTLLGLSVASLLVFTGIYPGIVKWLPTMLAGNLPMMNEAREYVIRESLIVHLTGMVLCLLPFIITVLAVRQRRHTLALIGTAVSLILVGYTTYAQIIIRAKAGPPMNENEPTNLARLVSYLSREQYGESPLFPRRFDSSPEAVEALKKYGPYTPPPMKTVSSDQYPGVTLNVPDYAKSRNTSGDWTYLFSYQIDHMFIRYLLWNFFGRTGDAQDADAWTFITSSKQIERVNFLSGYSRFFPIVFWGLPFLLGVYGAWIHVRRNPAQGLAFMAMFLVMGVFTAFVQNQQEPQPRERDYFYTGAFLVFALWVGLGAQGMISGIRSRVRHGAAGMVMAGLIVVAVPGSMAVQGWSIHSRAGNHLAFDYSYNILQSCEQDAILFTNGDNDTFPLWLLQDVYGIRRDVRVVNLSLAGGLTYLNQLKNTRPWGAKNVPITFRDEQLQADDRSPVALQARVSAPRGVSVPLSDAVRRAFGLPNTVRTMEWQSRGYDRGDGTFLFTRSQQVVEECVINTRFERPVYFAVTCGYPGSEIYCGLGDFCRQEGMVYRVCPTRVSDPGETIDERVMGASLLNPCSPENASETPRYGFIFRNLSTTGVYYDEIQRRYVDNYRTLFIRSAQHHLRNGRTATAKKYLDAMTNAISDEIFPMSYPLLNSVADFYAQAGDAKSARRYDEAVITQCRTLLEKPHLQSKISIFMADSPPALIAALACSREGRFDEALSFMDRAAQTSSGPGTTYQRMMIMVDRAVAKGSLAEAADLLRRYLDSTSAAADAVSRDARQRAEARLRAIEERSARAD